MRTPIPLLRLSPKAAGDLHQKHTQATTELQALKRYRKELDNQLKALLGYQAMRKLHMDTEKALLLADLIKEAA